jgi:hypothetical protein
MENVKKNWPQIAVGVVAIAVGLYILKKNSQKSMANVLVDVAQIKGNEWPKPRRIIDCNAP